MKIEKHHITHIRRKFHDIKSKSDLLDILNDARKFLYGENVSEIPLRSLTYYANPNLGKKRYRTFNIKKKSGGIRIIQTPKYGLKSILRALNFILNCLDEPHKAATGFVLGKSIVDNAIKHVGNNYVYNLDLKDFFHLFDRNRVKLVFMYPPFNLRENREPLAFLLASLCTNPVQVNDEERIVLPQGSPVSPTLTNILCKRLDRRLTGLSNRFNVSYSRYADDITFSSQHNIFQVQENEKRNSLNKYDSFIGELNRLILEEKLVLNNDKIRLQKSAYRQDVTGLTVNEKINVRRRFVKKIRMWLYYWEKYGYLKAEVLFKNDYYLDKGYNKKNNVHFVNVLEGKLQYLKMIKGTTDGTYNGLKKRFDRLINKSDSTYKIKVPERNILNNKNEINKFESLYPKLHNPQITSEILQSFTSNNATLKYATHGWELGKFISYENFINSIKNDWNSVASDLKNQNPKLYAKISNFLFNEKLGEKKSDGYFEVWGEKMLKFGWSSLGLRDFINIQNRDPFAFPIPEKIKKLDGKYHLNYFEDYIDIFKNEIEFREDSDNFKKILLDHWESSLTYDFNVELVDVTGFSFFTDVEYISRTIRLIFKESFKQRPQFPNIKIQMKKKFQDQFLVLTLTQENSICKRDINDTKLKSPGGTLSTIIKNLENLADFSVISRFSNGNIYRINYLSSLSQEFITESIEENITGFTFEMKFYI